MALSRIDTTNMIEDVPQSKLDNNINFRNIIINGDMSIAQRGTSASSISSGAGFDTVDRFSRYVNSGGTWTISQSTTVPSGQGFAKSLKFDCTTANGSLSADSELSFFTKFEGQNLQYLKKGTSSAESLTLSFWVRSNKTGTYTCELYDNDNTRAVGKTYTISSADTWEKKTITFTGDTTGVFGNDNGASLNCTFFLVAGTNLTSGTFSNGTWESATTANRVSSSQVNLADSTSNEFYITGIQLEAGQTASEFEFLPVDCNLQRCLRYYYLHASGLGQAFGTGFYYTGSYVIQASSYPVFMRATPSLEQVTGTGYYTIFRNSSSDAFDDFILSVSGSQRTNEKFFEIYNASDMSGTAGQGGFFRTNNANSFLGFDAEL